MDFVGVNRRQNESGVLRGGSFFRGLFLTEVVGLTVITNHFAEDLQSIYKFSGICDREYHGSLEYVKMIPKKLFMNGDNSKNFYYEIWYTLHHERI